MPNHPSEHPSRQDASSSSLQDDKWVVLAVRGMKAYYHLTQKYKNLFIFMFAK